MDDQEVNKIIAEFMGRKTVVVGDNIYFLNESFFHGSPLKKRDKPVNGTIESLGKEVIYTESLDALVPVWGKLQTEKIELEHFEGTFYCQLLKSNDCGLTMQQAAAHATALAIKELESE